jgi:CRP-like cAMP-binding protein
VESLNDSTSFDGIDAFFKCHQEIQKDHVFYRIGTRSDHFYLLAKGRVALYMNKDESATNEKQIHLLEHVIPGAMFGEV